MPKTLNVYNGTTKHFLVVSPHQGESNILGSREVNIKQ